MAVQLTVNSVDKTSMVDWRSVNKFEVLTKEPDTLEFSIKNYGTKTYRPAINDTVELFDGATKLFSGVIIETSDVVDGLATVFSVTCKDWTHTLDRLLVSKTYTAETAADIIDDILATYVEAGFTAGGVVAPHVVEKIVFNYMSVSQALQKLADILGDYDWYVDYDKVIHFFQESATSTAPFDITDTSANFVWNSLRFSQNVHQVRNHVIIRGGDVVGDQVTDTQQADGTQRIFFVGYDLDTFVFKKNGVTLDVGADGKDDPVDFDALYNPDRGLLIFPSALTAGDDVYSEGNPIFPLIAEKLDLVSIAANGTFQHVIVDKTIKSRDAASQRADAELEKWGTVASEAAFITYTAGLRTGQIIRVNSTLRGVDRYYKIVRTTTTMKTPTAFKYEIHLLASEDIGMVDILNKLLVKDVADQIEIGLNEVVDRLYSAFEEITIGESVALSIAHNPQTETITLAEVPIAQPLDYATEFVAGPYTPTISLNGADKKRVFLLNGSHLG